MPLILVTQDAEARGLQFNVSLCYRVSLRLSWAIYGYHVLSKVRKGLWVYSVVECLPSMCMAQGSFLKTTPRQTKVILGRDVRRVRNWRLAECNAELIEGCSNRSRNGVENLFLQLSKPRFPIYLSYACQLCLRARTSIFTLKELLVQLRTSQPVTRRWGTTKQVVYISSFFCEFWTRLVLRFPRRRRFQPEGEESGYKGGLHFMLRGSA